MKKAFFLLLCVFAALQTVHSQKLRVIYETDMGNDIDDAIALDVICDLEPMRKVMTEWPGEIVQNPFEVGIKVIYPSDILNSRLTWAENHPLVKAYNTYNPNPHNQYMWDILSVVYLLHPEMFGISERGTVEVDNKGITRFRPSTEGKHRYLITTDEQNKALQDMIIGITERKPKNFKK